MTMMNCSYEKQNLHTKYFPLPNSIFDLGLHPTAIAIYAYLLHIEDRETYECRVSYRTISEKLHMAINTVSKYVSELEESGLIRTEHTTHEMKDGSRRNGSLRYHILKIDDANDMVLERKLNALDRSLEVKKVRERASELGVEIQPA